MQKSKLCFQVHSLLDVRNLIQWACHILRITPSQGLGQYFIIRDISISAEKSMNFNVKEIKKGYK